MNEVFIYDITNEKTNEFKVSSFLRNEYISSITDENRKKQSYFVWKVLEKQLTTLGVNINDNFVNNNGKWSLRYGDINFSISHSKNIVCVALSDNKIGVDVEKIDNKILKLEKKLVVDGCKSEEEKIIALTSKWTAKEALIKSNNHGDCNYLIIKDANNEKYVVCVASNGAVNFNIIDTI